MKVCTDSCLFGAWVTEQMKEHEIATALDIGAGTGLLSLMFAQKNTSVIDTIEIDTAAAEQAKENTLLSPWHHRINIINKSLQEFIPIHQYDFIFSNPPFFEDDLQASNSKKNNAKHSTSITLQELISFISIHLTLNGSGAVIIPYHRIDYFQSQLNKLDFYFNKLALVKQTPYHPYFRAMIIFSKTKIEKFERKEIVIHDANRNYTTEFAALLKDYYLKL